MPARSRKPTARKPTVFEVADSDITSTVLETLGEAFLRGKKALYIFHDEEHEMLFVSRKPIPKKAVLLLTAERDEEEERDMDPDED